MKNSKQHIENLIDAYLCGKISNEKRYQLERAYVTAAMSKSHPDDLEIDQIHQLKKQSLKTVLQRIRRDKVKHISTVQRISIAAALAAIVFGLWFFNTRYDRSGKDLVAAGKNIHPGKNTAVLTTADGEVIALSDKKSGIIIEADQLSYSDGSKLNFSSDTESGTPGSKASLGKLKDIAVTTPLGGTYQVILSDGTKVWLNAGSRISFPSRFVDKERKVLLSGEAYFQVSPDKSRPFRIISKGQQVEVLGTHFNINAYQDEASTKTTLLEGSVKVNNSIVLKPNEQSVLTSNNLLVKRVNGSAAIDWKNGKFIFEDEDLETILRKVSRWYNVQIVDQRKVRTPITFKGSFSRYDNISKVLSKLEFAGQVKFEIRERIITVVQ